MSDIEIKLKQSNGGIVGESMVELSFKCSQLEAGLIIDQISKNHNVNIRIDSKGASMGSFMNDGKPHPY